MNKVKGWLPGFATGGIVTQPTIAQVGEKGREYIIPMDGSARAIGLLSRAAQELGMLFVPQASSANSGEAGRGGGYAAQDDGSARAISRLGMQQQPTPSPAQELSSAAAAVNTTNNSFGGASLTFSPRIDVAPGQSDAGAVKQAVTDALTQALERFEEMAENMQYQKARVAMR